MSKYQALHYITQPTRWKILVELSKGELFINEIAEITKVSQRNTSFHCSSLLKHGYLKSRFDKNEMGSICIFYTLSKQGKKVFDTISKYITTRDN